MNPLQWILIAINGISTLTNNPAIAGSNLKLAEASDLLAFLGELISRGEEGYRELKIFADTIGQMVVENRGPTPEEWSTMKSRSDAASDVIQEARRRAEAEEEALIGEPTEPTPGGPSTEPPEIPPVSGGENEGSDPATTQSD